MSTIRHRNLPLLLAQAREAVISNFRPILNHLGVTEQQWRIVRVLHENDSLEPWQISELCQILKPSLTGVLTRMEEMGLIARCKHESDQRRQVVTLTDRARQLVADAAPLVEKQYQALEKALGKELVADLYRVLDQLLDKAETPVPRVALPGRRATRKA